MSVHVQAVKLLRTCRLAANIAVGETLHLTAQQDIKVTVTHVTLLLLHTFANLAAALLCIQQLCALSKPTQCYVQKFASNAAYQAPASDILDLPAIIYNRMRI